MQPCGADRASDIYNIFITLGKDSTAVNIEVIPKRARGGNKKH